MNFVLILAFVLHINSAAQSNSSEYWSEVDEAVINNNLERIIIPDNYKTFKINYSALRSFLSTVPLEGPSRSIIRDAFTLPLPNGEYGRFSAFESPIMEPGLASKYPEIKTYLGQGIDDKSATVRFDITPAGFHAMIISASGTVYIDPYSRDDNEHYLSYYKRDFKLSESEPVFECGPIEADEIIINEMSRILSTNSKLRSGENLRTYRLALACTGEYTSFHGGTVPQALAAMTTTMNRVNGVYEREVAIRMVLIANNDLIIYTNAGSDPYTNNSGFTMLGENQTNIDAVIGNANYDIGHVFSTGGGGIANLGVPCRTSLKARGVTGLFSPIGDPFDIDYVAHEMGHQWAANHTFNGSSGACSGGNRNPSTAYEPGSGSTIMAYAGICSPQNLQNNSDDYFHWKSLDEIIAYSTLSFGNNCPVTTATGNNAPVADAGTGGFTIPKSTPFMLTGSATDTDSDPMTYCWEEADLGPAGHPNSPSGNAPIFRTFDPITSPSRTFPKWLNILNNSQSIGEILPSYARDLNFSFTARDNRAGGGGIGKDQISFSVDGSSGPFLVTYPNSSVSLPADAFYDITWDVANTNTAPVNCAIVNILLSLDGGSTFSIVLASNTPNDGVENVLIPDNTTSTARIMVEAADNIFFDVSNTNFSITPAIPVELVSFNAFVIKNGVYLEWKTATETNNSGFSLEKSSDNVKFSEISFIDGNGTTSETSVYSYADYSSISGIQYFRLKQIDFNGTFEYSKTIEIDLGLPKQFSLSQNHPNPFNPSTTIEFSLPVEAQVTIKLFNSIGEEVSEIANQNYTGGVHEVFFNARNLSSGIYFYTIDAKGNDGSNFVSSKKMILMK